MTHFTSSAQVERTTPPEWLGVGAKVGQLVNEWAGRSDLVAYVGENAGVQHGAPALYNPASAEVQVNIPIAFGTVTPEQVGDLTERRQQFEFLKGTGAILHEALHARFSTWDLAKAAVELPPRVCEALHLLEESRIEAWGARLMPDNKSFLKACALEIVIGDMESEQFQNLSTTRQAALLAGISLARIDADILDADDIQPVTDLLATVLPSELIIDLTMIWREFQGLRPETELARMYELATEWDRLVTERAEEQGEEQDGETTSEGGMSEEFMEAIREALEEAADSTAISAMDDAGEQQTTEEYRETANRARSSAEERRSHEKVSEKIFGTGHTASDSGSNSRLTERRKPSSDERISAVKISQALEKAKYHDRVRTEVASELPPGRLRTRALVQGQAYRDRGLMMSTQPFERVMRKHVDDPNLTIGVMVDISGSMGDAMEPMASAAWILSEATRRVQGKVAMVYYGSGVFPTLKAGQHLTDVNVYSAPDGTEKFDEAFKALDGSLNLLHGEGARLLVVVSDGEYTNDEQRKAKKWVERCGRAGVGVLWIGAGWYGDTGKRYVNGKESQFIRMEGKATSVADAIGRSAASALSKAGEIRQS